MIAVTGEKQCHQDINELLSFHCEKSQTLREGLAQNKVLYPVTTQ